MAKGKGKQKFPTTVEPTGGNSAGLQRVKVLKANGKIRLEWRSL